MIIDFTGRKILILIGIRNIFPKSQARKITYYVKNKYLIESRNFPLTVITRRCLHTSQRVFNEEQTEKKKKKKTLIIPHFDLNEILHKCEGIAEGDPKKLETLIIQSNKYDNAKNFSKLDKFTLINSMTSINKSTKEILKDSSVPEWKKQKLALKQKFQNQGWSPLKKVSREDMESIKTLKKNMPLLNNSQIGEYFKISPEAVRRILKSNWKPKNLEEDEQVYERWKKRGERIKTMYQPMDNISNIDDPKNMPAFLSQEDKFKLYNSDYGKRMSNKKRRLLKKQKKLSNNGNSHENDIGDWEF